MLLGGIGGRDAFKFDVLALIRAEYDRRRNQIVRDKCKPSIYYIEHFAVVK